MKLRRKLLEKVDNENSLLEHYEKLEKDLGTYPPATRSKIIKGMSEYFEYKSFRCPSNLIAVCTIASAINSLQSVEIESACRLYGINLSCLELDLVRTIVRI